MTRPQPAAFFRLEHTLCERTAAATAIWLTSHAQTFRGRFAGLRNTLLAHAIEGLGQLREDVDTLSLRWRGLRGMGRDRLIVLGQEYLERFILPELKPAALDLIEQAHARGFTTVLVSDSLDVIVDPLAEHLGVDLTLCNRALADGYHLTGELAAPVFSGRMSAQLLTRFADAHRLDLHLSRGYGTRADDSLLLNALGHPCAVDPDPKLLSLARELSWPVVQP